MKKGMGCNECTHPTCAHSLHRNSVCACVECENGILVFDSSSGPKWRMACNKYIYFLLSNISHFQPFKHRMLNRAVILFPLQV